MQVYIFLDVGGTELKLYLFDALGVPLFSKPQKFPSLSNQPSDIIFSHFTQIFESVYRSDLKVLGVGMAFPGPFDYERGVSLMKGISKYDSIYGQPIVPEIRKRSSFGWIQRVPFLFLHDVAAFALGICSMATYHRYTRIMHLVIGTGAGSAFTNSGDLVVSSLEVPEHGWIYNTPFRDSIIDDYISVRGFTRLSQAVYGEPLDGYSVQQMAESGDRDAQGVFTSFGETIIEAVQPFFESFSPDAFLLGGQMSKGFKFFGNPLLAYCEPRGVEIFCEYNTSEVICRGLYGELHKGVKNNGIK